MISQQSVQILRYPILVHQFLNSMNILCTSLNRTSLYSVHCSVFNIFPEFYPSFKLNRGTTDFHYTAPDSPTSKNNNNNMTTKPDYNDGVVASSSRHFPVLWSEFSLPVGLVYTHSTTRVQLLA